MSHPTFPISHILILQTGGILREAHEAIARFPPPLLLLLPGLIALSICLLFSYWLIVSLYIGSAGTPIHGVLHPDRRLQLLFWVHTIGVAWSAEALLHLGFCAAAGVAVRWYFGADIASNGGAARVVLGALGSTLRSPLPPLAPPAHPLVPPLGTPPTWQVDGELYPGEKDLEELEEILGVCVGGGSAE